MGKTDNKIIDTARAATGSKNHSSTEATSETKRGRGRPRKNPAGEPTAGTGSETVTDVPRLVLVEDPNAAEEVEGTSEPAPAAPKNPSKRKRKEIQFEFKKEQLAILIKTSFDIIGSREGLEMWKLSQKEAELIADPLSGLLAKNPMIDRITSEYGEWIALIVALGTVIVPRAFVMWAAKPDKKEKIKPYVAIAEPNKKQTERTATSGNERRETRDRDRKLDRESAASSANISAELYNLVPAIQ